MINGIGLSNGSGLSGIGGQSPTQRGEAAGRLSPANSSVEDRGAVTSTVTRIAAMGAPIDTDRVAALRAAIRSGSYRADPARIAGTMIDGDLGAGL